MRKAFNFYNSYYQVYKSLNDKQKVEFMDSMLKVQFLEEKMENISFADKMVGLLWNTQNHSVKKQIEGYCNSIKIDYNSLFMVDSNAYEGAYEGASVQEEGKVKEEEKEKEKEYVTNASLRFATLSLNSTKDNSTHKPRQAFKELEVKYKEEFSTNDELVSLAKRFVEYRDEMYISTKDKKYAIYTSKSIVGFLNEMAEVNDYEKAFSMMESNEWATFKREWTKEKI